LAKGIFVAGRSYPAFIRFSGYDQETQNNSDAKGMAIKISGVTGAKLLPGFTDDTHVDFLLNASPILAQNNETVLAATVMARTQLSGGGDRGRAGLINFYPQVVARDLAERQNSAVSSSLNIAYYSVSAYKFGLDPLPAPAVKYRVIPCTGVEAPGFNAAGAAVDYLSTDMVTKLAAAAYCFNFQIQLQTNVCNQPINDLSVEWLEAASPFVTVATINIPIQAVTNDVNLTCRHTAFNPWRTTAEHRPLGSANRARLFAYMNAQNQRLSLNLAVEPSTGKVYPGWQTFANTELGINDQFQTPVVKTGFPYNPQAGNFHAPYTPIV
jgi:catalase